MYPRINATLRRLACQYSIYHLCHWFSPSLLLFCIISAAKNYHPKILSTSNNVMITNCLQKLKSWLNVCNLQPTNRQGQVSQVDRKALVIHLYHLDLKFKRHNRGLLTVKWVYIHPCRYAVADPGHPDLAFSTSLISSKSIFISFFKPLFRW